MALSVCAGCSAAYAVGLPACPQCGSTEHRPDYEEDGMANITSAGVFYDEGKEPDGYVDPRTAEDPAAPELPAKSAPKADWVDAAVNVAGADPDEAAAMTKADLVETVQAAVPPPPPPES